MNILTLVADSCRYDSIARAKADCINEYFVVKRGWAQATFTLPAHAAMFAGFYPSTQDQSPLYDRLDTTLFRWFYSKKRKHLIPLADNTSVPRALSDAGWNTVCTGGVGWFSNYNSILPDGFRHFSYQFCPKLAILNTINELGRKDPFYAVLNFGVTHRPYFCPFTETMPYLRPPLSGHHDSGYDGELHYRQIRCVEYLSECLPHLMNWLCKLSEPTLVCFCADHGECFGEDGYFGHGFYHPKVMEVPVAWTLFVDGKAHPITKQTISLVERCLNG